MVITHLLELCVVFRIEERRLAMCYNLEYYYVIVRMHIVLDSNFFVVPLIVYVIVHVL